MFLVNHRTQNSSCLANSEKNAEHRSVKIVEGDAIFAPCRIIQIISHISRTLFRSIFPRAFLCNERERVTKFDTNVLRQVLSLTQSSRAISIDFSRRARLNTEIIRETLKYYLASTASRLRRDNKKKKKKCPDSLARTSWIASFARCITKEKNIPQAAFRCNAQTATRFYSTFTKTKQKQKMLLAREEAILPCTRGWIKKKFRRKGHVLSGCVTGASALGNDSVPSKRTEAETGRDTPTRSFFEEIFSESNETRTLCVRACDKKEIPCHIPRKRRVSLNFWKTFDPGAYGTGQKPWPWLFARTLRQLISIVIPHVVSRRHKSFSIRGISPPRFSLSLFFLCELSIARAHRVKFKWSQLWIALILYFFLSGLQDFQERISLTSPSTP